MKLLLFLRRCTAMFMPLLFDRDNTLLINKSPLILRGPFKSLHVNSKSEQSGLT